jgi:hypothetical protein
MHLRVASETWHRPSDQPMGGIWPSDHFGVVADSDVSSED